MCLSSITQTEGLPEEIVGWKAFHQTKSWFGLVKRLHGMHRGGPYKVGKAYQSNPVVLRTGDRVYGGEQYIAGFHIFAHHEDVLKYTESINVVIKQVRGRRLTAKGKQHLGWDIASVALEGDCYIAQEMVIL